MFIYLNRKKDLFQDFLKIFQEKYKASINLNQPIVLMIFDY